MLEACRIVEATNYLTVVRRDKLQERIARSAPSDESPRDDEAKMEEAMADFAANTTPGGTWIEREESDCPAPHNPSPYRQHIHGGWAPSDESRWTRERWEQLVIDTAPQWWVKSARDQHAPVDDLRAWFDRMYAILAAPVREPLEWRATRNDEAIAGKWMVTYRKEGFYLFTSDEDAPLNDAELTFDGAKNLAQRLQDVLDCGERLGAGQ